jgi:[ribosomal protein S18]-alanine N-acetyltransferase
MNVSIRLMTASDLPLVVDLQHDAFSHPWTENMLRSELSHEWSRVFLAFDDVSVLVGFAVVWLVHDELHVLNIASRSSHRRQGIAQLLFARILSLAQEFRCQNMTLEVRKSNTAAIALYEKFRFQAVGTRRAYYQDNQEDALVMTCAL